MEATEDHLRRAEAAELAAKNVRQAALRGQLLEIAREWRELAQLASEQDLRRAREKVA